MRVWERLEDCLWRTWRTSAEVKEDFNGGNRLMNRLQRGGEPASFQIPCNDTTTYRYRPCLKTDCRTREFHAYFINQLSTSSSMRTRPLLQLLLPQTIAATMAATTPDITTAAGAACATITTELRSRITTPPPLSSDPGLPVSRLLCGTFSKTQDKQFRREGTPCGYG